MGSATSAGPRRRRTPALTPRSAGPISRVAEDLFAAGAGRRRRRSTCAARSTDRDGGCRAEARARRGGLRLEAHRRRRDAAHRPSPRSAGRTSSDLSTGIEELGRARRVRVGARRADSRASCSRSSAPWRPTPSSSSRSAASSSPPRRRCALVDRLLDGQAPRRRRSPSCATSCSSPAGAASASCSATRPTMVADQRGFDDRHGHHRDAADAPPSSSASCGASTAQYGRALSGQHDRRSRRARRGARADRRRRHRRQRRRHASARLRQKLAG